MEARWAPSSPEERSYYDGLFVLADTSKVGRLAGQSAVGFLGKSGLPFPILKQVWDLSAHPNLNFLRPEDFYVAMRLMAMAQASPGVSISADRLTKESARPLPLARMQNVPPPPAGVTSQGLARSGGALVLHEPNLAADLYAMSSQERSKYESIFPMYDSDTDGFVTGAEAVELFSKSRLPREHLRQIWQLADADGDSKLSIAEFCVGMHLIVCVSKKGLPCPATRPPSLLGGPGSISGADATSPAQASSSSPATSVPPSPAVRSSPAIQPPPSPPSAMLSRGPEASGCQDAFSALAVDLPAKDPTSAGSTAEVGTPALEQGSTVMDQAQHTAQPRHNTASGSPTDTTVSDNDSSVGDSSTMTSSQPTSAGTHTGTPELIAASSALLAVTRDVSIVYNQAVMAQSSNVHRVKVLVEQLQAEKASLGSIVEAGRVEHMDTERQLRDMGTEIANLSLELETLRNKYQEQQKESAKLRARVAQATVERATLLADVKACGSSLNAQKDENAFLRGTVLGEDDYSEDTRPSAQSTATNKEEESPSQAAERVRTSSESSEVEAKIDAPAEPVMPVETPPPPPNGMVPKPAVEDPFAEVVGEKSSESAGILSTHGPVAESQGFNDEERRQGGFDAFPAVGFENGMDPFATNGFSENAVGEAVDDPFKATDAVFTNATAAADDGFDAFPSSADAQQFDAFGQ